MFFAALLTIASAYALAQPPAVPPQPMRPVNPVRGVPMTPEQVELGRKLFFDARLSRDGTVSCSTCHRPDHGWAEPLPVSAGIRGQLGDKNAPTVLTAHLAPLQFWDGRVIGTELQSLQPLVNPLEMGNQSQQQVVNRLNRIDGYRSLSVLAYGGLLTRERMAHAIASFEASLLPNFDAPIDARLAGYTRQLDPAQERGFQVFARSNCMDCHAPPYFTDFRFHNNGAAAATGTLSPGRFGILGPNQRTAADVRAHKTPTLREIQATAPYTHGGRVATVRQVVDLYNVGWAEDRFRDPRVRPLGLTDREKADLTHFLETAFASPTFPRIQPPGLPR